MKYKIIPIICEGYYTRFFTLPTQGDDWSEKPHLQISTHMDASFALIMGEDCLNPNGIHQGDYLLFSMNNPLQSNDQLSLIRNEEDEYRICEAYWLSDNQRVVAILNHVIKANEDLRIVYFQ